MTTKIQMGVQMAGGADKDLEAAVAFIQGDDLYPEVKPYKRNAVFCNLCGTVAESGTRHAMNSCKCGKVSADGGLDYLRRVFSRDSDFTELSELNPDYLGRPAWDPKGARHLPEKR